MNALQSNKIINRLKEANHRFVVQTNTLVDMYSTTLSQFNTEEKKMRAADMKMVEKVDEAVLNFVK